MPVSRNVLLPALVLTMGAFLNCKPAGDPVAAKGDKVQAIFAEFVQKKYELIRAARTKLKSDPDVARILSYKTIEGVEPLDARDAELARAQSEEEANLKIWRTNLTKGAEVIQKLNASVKDKSKGMADYVRRESIGDAKMKFFGIPSEERNADQWRAKRIARFEQDAASDPGNVFVKASLTALRATRDFRADLQKLAEAQFQRVQDLFKG
ncbi:MAG: hypothetical protein HYZ13_03815 [Acidobacteria bacterium]|nr:hypothetical protein [Acidobacteriota bacterium]